MNFTSQIQTLRARCPIGLKHAEKLLTQTNGDVHEAEILFKQSMVKLFIEKTQSTIEAATLYLNKFEYDLGSAVRTFEEDKCGVTALIFRKIKDKEAALDKTLIVLEQKYNCSFWLCNWNDDNLIKITPPQQTFVFLMEWLNYESWEGDLIFNTDIAYQWQQLGVNWLADEMNNVIARYNELEPENKAELWNDSVYKSFEGKFYQNKQQLINRLYDYVTDNLTQFP